MRSLLLLAALAAAAPAAGQPVPVGRAEFMNSCAQCHGRDGRGDGPLAGYLTVELPDLTRLSANNGGAFPAERLRRTISGENMLGPHGTGEMPAWGWRYAEDAAKRLGTASAGAPEAFVRERIDALVGYIESLQTE